MHPNNSLIANLRTNSDLTLINSVRSPYSGLTVSKLTGRFKLTY
jgi:hypothetical protein